MWFKVDDDFSHHRKALAAGNAAVGLWTRSGAWSGHHLTDGFVPSAVVPTVGTTREARALVAAGLWVPVDGGYRFHDWELYQPTAAEVLAKQAGWRARQDRHRGITRASVTSLDERGGR